MMMMNEQGRDIMYVMGDDEVWKRWSMYGSGKPSMEPEAYTFNGLA